jgi:ABC-type branched-subunit amino acid transport system ATPase component
VSLEVAAGTTHAIVGPNGSGKTTLLNMISGFYPIDSGTILIDGRSVVGMAPHRIARNGVGRTFQTPRMLPQLSVLDNALLGAFPAERQGAAAAALCLPRAWREQAASLGDALRYLDFVGLTDRAMELAGELPHGQQRLAEIARALVGRPRLLLLDEPAAGLSADETKRLSAAIRAIAKRGTTVLLIEHDMKLVMNTADTIAVLDFGRKVVEGPPAQIRQDPAVIAAYLGVGHA